MHVDMQLRPRVAGFNREREERKKERKRHANFDHNASDIILPTQKFEAGRGSILYNNNNNQELRPLDVSSPPLASLPPPSLPPPLTSGSFFLTLEEISRNLEVGDLRALVLGGRKSR